MNGNTHVLIGVTTGLWLAHVYQLTPLTGLTVAVASGAAALLPDIDHPRSTISYKARPARLVFRWFGHRGLTHSLLALFAVGALCSLLPLPWGIAIVAGYGSHILADMATHGGVRLLYPFRGFIALPLTITTGGMGELMVRVLVMVGLVYVGSLILIP